MSRAACVALVCGLALPLAQPARSAQSLQATGDTDLEEVVVTGERLSRPLHETASSVAVITAGSLQSAPDEDRLEQVLAGVPNVLVTSAGEGPTIRGQDSTGVLRDLPAFLGGARPRASLQVDGRIAGFNEFIFGAAPLWDVERVEVFRSPQTTTQGRNAIGGALFITTRDPTPEWEARLRVLGGNYATRQGSFALSGPLAGDQFALRVAGDIRRSHTASRIGDVYDDVNPNRDRYGLLRMKLLATPRAWPGLRMQATYAHVESQMPQIEGISLPFEARENPLPTYGVFATDVDSIVLETRIDTAAGVHSRTTLSAGDALIERSARTIGTAKLGETRTVSRDAALESVVDFEPFPGVSLLGGVHLSRLRLDQYIDLSAALGAGPFDDLQRSAGAFGELRLGRAVGWSLTAGLRYQHDTQHRTGQLASASTSYPVAYRGSTGEWLPKISVAYAVGDELTLGLLAQRASNPGGTSYDFQRRAQRDFAGETAWNYEAFARARLAGGRASLNLNIFRTETRDAQRADTRLFQVPGVPPVLWAEIGNVPRAASQGLEAELHWSIHERLRVNAALGLLDTELFRANATPGAAASRFQGAPASMGSVGIEVRPWRASRVSLQARRRSGYYSDDANTPGLFIDAATVVDARAGFRHGHWSIDAYLRNAFDRFYLTKLFNAAQATAGDPREFGVAFELER